MSNVNGNYGNIISKLKKGRPTLQANGELINFLQTEKSLRNLETYNKFIKNVETMVRKSPRYKQYKSYIMNEVGLNKCMIFPGISADIESNKKSKITLEMHHGPLLTLFDSCCIVTDHFLKNDKPVNSMIIAKTILDEHDENRIEVMILCDLAHILYHAQKIYINPKQAFGKTLEFLEKYRDGVDDRMKTIINKNLELSRQYNSIDKEGILDVVMSRWDNGKFELADVGLKDGWEDNPVNPLKKIS